jgi:hypothetical protein
MTNYVPVKDHPDLVRDMNTGMILNINKSKTKQKKLEAAQRQKDRQELDELKSDVSEIKMMLQKLLENGTNG